MRNAILTAVFLATGLLLVSQEALNNDGVIKLLKAGLSEDLIVSTINVQPGVYDTSAKALKSLKAAGVSDKLVSAMVAKNNTPESGKAIIYVYRPGEMKGAAGYWLLYADGAYAGKLLNSTYVRVETTPGIVVFSQLSRVHWALPGYAALALLQKDAKEIDRFQVEAGKTYYVKWAIHFTGPKMEPVDQAKGEKDMRHCHPDKSVAVENQ